jgi:hypothetical protein
MKLILDNVTFCTEKDIPVCVHGSDLSLPQRINIAGALSDAIIAFNETALLHADFPERLLNALNIRNRSSKQPEVHIHLILK